MRLIRLHTKNIRGLRDGTFSFRAAPGSAVVVTGEPRSGKTSLLRAIAAARRAVEPHESPPIAAELMARAGADAELRAGWQWQDRTFDVRWKLAEAQRPELPAELSAVLGSPERPRGGFEFFPARRALDTRRTAPLLATGSAAARLNRYVDGAEKYQGLWAALSTAVTDAASRVAAVVAERGVVFGAQVPDALAGYKAGVAKMCPSVRLVAMEPRERLRPWMWFETEEGRRVEVADLSDSELAGVLFACTFAWLGLDRSIVLIDTPELFVHPAEHERFFRALCDLGADSQLIVVTTSPGILQSVAPDQIIDLSKPEKTR